jgi:hypothetical protein
MVVLILLSGAGNFWATREGTGANRVEIDTVLRQLHELTLSAQAQRGELEALREGMYKQEQILTEIQRSKHQEGTNQ